MKNNYVTEITALSEDSINLNKLYYDNFSTAPRHLYAYSVRNANIDEFVKNFYEFLETSKEYLNISKFIYNYESIVLDIGEEDNSEAHESADMAFSIFRDECTADSSRGNRTEYYFINSRSNKLLIRFWTDKSSEFTIRFYFHDQEESNLQFIESVKKLFPTKAKERVKNTFNIICNEGKRLYIKEFDLKSEQAIDGLDFYDLYNPDFKEVSEHIINKLQTDNKGLVLLHGKAGTGKTSYLKYLIKTLAKKNIIYLPPDMTRFLSSPEFFSFLLEHPKSILIIEDAENVLKHREAGGDQAVSNILNISDGILGNALQYQIIATFNSSPETIDEALRRPGRLIGEYNFESIKANHAEYLLNKIHPKIDLSDKEIVDMTLAEIFNFDEKRYLSKSKKIKMGFIG